ncbi:MAG: ribonuclease P protein component [bacterium]|nr:ribonuclease P protein component [bacterium]
MLLRISSQRLSSGKLTIVVSAKFFKKAVVRNLLKRRIRAISKPFLKELSSGILVRISPGADQALFNDLKEEFKKEIKIFLKK